MLQRRPFARQTMPERKPTVWPGPQSFAPAARCDGVGAAQPKLVEHRNPALLAKAWQAYELGTRNMRRRDFDLFRSKTGIGT